MTRTLNARSELTCNVALGRDAFHDGNVLPAKVFFAPPNAGRW